MTANDTALAALQAQNTQLQTDFNTLSTDVAALIAAIGTDNSDDISAGVNAVTSDLDTLDSSVTALDATVTAATPGATPATPATDATPEPDADAPTASDGTPLNEPPPAAS
jgi:outer membrane murein-binding lipoprotein Lpp